MCLFVYLTGFCILSLCRVFKKASPNGKVRYMHATGSYGYMHMPPAIQAQHFIWDFNVISGFINSGRKKFSSFSMCRKIFSNKIWLGKNTVV